MIKVSVIIPVYNVEIYLRECLDSVVNQTLKDIEIICINDGSTDNSLEILNEYAEKDNRIIVINQENQGAGAARNAGIKIARGKYLSILDSDDIFDTTMLEKMYQKSEAESLDINICRCRHFNNQTMAIEQSDWTLKTELLPTGIFNKDDIPRNIFGFCVGWSWDKLYNREFVVKNKLKFQNLRNSEDMLFVFLSLVLAKKISYMDEVLVTHRYNTKTQLSETRDKNPFCFLEALYELKNQLENRNLYEKFEQSYINWALEFCFWHLDTINQKNAEKLYMKLQDEFFCDIKIYSKAEDYFYYPEIYERVKYFCISRENRLKKSPKVSIIIPTYNVERYLKECLDSVVNQTLKDIEIIAVDDGSTDNSGKILDDYAEKDKRIKVIHKTNSSYGHSMNVGLENATGEYIGIVEPDDYVKLDMFKILYNKALINNADFIKADFCKFVGDGSNREFFYNKLSFNNTYYNRIINPQNDLTPFNFMMNTWSGIYNRNFIEQNHIRYNETPGASFQDNGFWFQTFTRAERVYFLDKPFYMYRYDNENSSVKSKSKVYCMKEEYDFIRKYLEKNPELKEKFIQIYWYKKFHNYMFNFNRIDIKFKKEFLFKCFSPEFKKAAKDKEIDYNMFNPFELKRLKQLIHNPQKFYCRALSISTLPEKIFSIKNKNNHKQISALGIKLKIKR